MFLKASNLCLVLSQVLDEDIMQCMVVTSSGEIVSRATQTKFDDEVAVIGSKMWEACYSAKINADDDNSEENLEMVSFDFENGRFVLTDASRFLVCIYARSTLSLNILKGKLQGIQTLLAARFEELPIH